MPSQYSLTMMLATLVTLALQAPAARPNPAPPIALEVLTDKSVYRSGEPIKITLQLRNTSTKTLVLAKSDGLITRRPQAAWVHLSVKGEKPLAIILPNTYASLRTVARRVIEGSDFVTLAPGKTLKLDQEATGEFWPGGVPGDKRSMEAAVREPLPAGKYEIRAAWMWTRKDALDRAATINRGTYGQRPPFARADKVTITPDARPLLAQAVEAKLESKVTIQVQSSD